MRVYVHGSDPDAEDRGHRLSTRFSELCANRMISTCVRRHCVLLLGAVLLGGVLIACGTDAGARNVEVNKPRLVQTPSGQRVFTGTLVNRGSSTISIAEVEVALYDEQGSRIETMRIQVQDVPPQDSVEFDQTIDSDRSIQQAQVQRVLVP